MDFLDPKKRKAHLRRLYIGYGLMAVLVLSMAGLLALQALGWSIDPRTGTITQNGLVFVNSQPVAADIFLNGQNKGTGDQRLVLPAGNYNLELRAEGYRPWQRQFFLEGGHIERLVYPFLFPDKLQTDQLQLYESEPPLATQSPDRRWLLVQKPSSLSEFELYDLNLDVPLPIDLTLPANLLTATGSHHRLEMVEWSTDNRRVILKHIFSGGSEFILVDREVTADSVNLNLIFPNVPFTSIRLKDKKFDRFYLHDSASGTLRQAELQSRRVSVTLENVLQFIPHGDDVILYVTPSSTDKSKVVATVLDGEEKFAIKQYPAKDKYLLEIARYDDTWYVVSGAVSEGKVYVARNPMDASRQTKDAKLIPAAILRIENGQFVSFSHNARFIAAQSGSRFAVYDAETDRIFRYDTELKLPPNHQAVWMDGHRLTVNSNSKTIVFDYDGINRQTLVNAHPNFKPFFKQDYADLYTIGPAPNIDGRSALLRTSLVVEASQ